MVRGSGVTSHKATGYLSNLLYQHVGAHSHPVEVLMQFLHTPQVSYTHQGKPRRYICTVSYCWEGCPCTGHRCRRSTSGCRILHGRHRCTLLLLRHSCGHYIHTSLGCLDVFALMRFFDMTKRLRWQNWTVRKSRTALGGGHCQILTVAGLPSYEVPVLDFVSSSLLQPAVV